MHKYFGSNNVNFLDIVDLKGYPFNPVYVTKFLQRTDITDTIALNKYFSKWRTKFQFEEHSKLRNQDIVVSAQYDYEVNSILIFVSSKKGIKFVNMTDAKKSKLGYDIILAVMHEMVHRKQFHHRHDYNDYHYEFRKTGDKKLDQEYTYYSDVDEVFAYAHCIYSELKTEYPDLSIAEILKKRKLHSPILATYREMYTNNSDTFSQLIREIFRWERKYNEVIGERGLE